MFDLKFIAKAIDLPTSGSADKTSVMISGKLREIGRDPRNVRVMVRRDLNNRESLSLVDVDGVFVDVGTLGGGGAGDGEVDGHHDEESDSISSERGSPTLDERTELKHHRAETNIGPPGTSAAEKSVPPDRTQQKTVIFPPSGCRQTQKCSDLSPIVFLCV